MGSNRRRRRRRPLMKTGLEKVGYWRSSRETHLPKASEFLDPEWDAGVRAAVLAHIKQGEVNNRWRGSSKCRICGVRNGSRCLTDGVYVWPEGLAHYVESHSLRPPHAFVNHVMAVRFKSEK